MRLIILLLVLSSCANATKSVLICGDHECVNKREAELYFKENLSIEIKIIDKKEIKSYDLVSINTNNNEKSISLSKIDSQENDKLITLSKDQIKKKKIDIKNQDKAIKIANKNARSKKKINQKKIIQKDNDSLSKKDTVLSKLDKKKTISKSNKTTVNKPIKKMTNKDICLVLDKCDIDSISSYLMKKGLEKDYPSLN